MTDLAQILGTLREIHAEQRNLKTELEVLNRSASRVITRDDLAISRTTIAERFGELEKRLVQGMFAELT